MPEPIEIHDIPLSEPKLDDLDSLPRFFEEIEGFFIDIVYHWNPVLFPKKYRGVIKQAWQEIAGTLRNIVRGGSASIQGFDWTNAGLGERSEQLNLKLGVLRDAWNKFDENGSSRQLQGVLKIINLILGSISTEMKIVEKIKEFGEFVEATISGDFGHLDTFLRTL